LSIALQFIMAASILLLFKSRLSLTVGAVGA
jgi:hypothetical protein